MPAPDLTDHEMRVLRAVAADNATGNLAHAADLAQAMNLPVEVVRSAIDRLSALGLVERPLN